MCKNGFWLGHRKTLYFFSFSLFLAYKNQRRHSHTWHRLKKHFKFCLQLLILVNNSQYFLGPCAILKSKWKFWIRVLKQYGTKWQAFNFFSLQKSLHPNIYLTHLDPLSICWCIRNTQSQIIDTNISANPSHIRSVPVIDDKIRWYRHGRKKLAKMFKEWWFANWYEFTEYETFLDRTFILATLGFTVSCFYSRETPSWPK